MINTASQRGYSLIEMLIYTAILASLSVLVVQTFLALAPSYAQLRAARALDQAAQGVLERMVREIHGATSVVTAQSTFDTHPGRLTLNTLDEGGTPTTVEFYLENGAVKIREGGAPAGALTSGVTVANLVFRTASNTRTTFIKIEMTASTTIGKITRTQSYFAGAALRGAY